MMTHAEPWTIVLAGECMVTRPFGVHTDPAFLDLVNILRRSDVTYAHLETNLGHYNEVDWPARGDQIGSYFLSDPQIAQDLRWAGIDIASLANNHSYDFGAPGLLATIEHCRRAGIVHAGTGVDLEEAREPGYLETEKGRVALVAVSSGNKSNEWAGLPKGSMRGRPGVNPLRVTTKFHVDPEAAEQLRAIGRNLDILRQKGSKVEGSTGASMRALANEFSFALPSDQSTSGSNIFVESDRFEIETQCNPADLAANLRSIEEATTMADLTIVAHHFNISEGRRGDTPPRFAREFAHAAIDAGADMYLGHGWHKTLGIEIYRGKPIVYGMGNFFAQSEFVRRVPYDAYETWGHDIEQLPTLHPAVHPLHPGLEAGAATWWSSAVFVVTLGSDGVQRIQLVPVELGREVEGGATLRRPVGKGLTDGRPRLAEGEDAARVLERFKDLSAPFGTDVEIDGSVGVIDLMTPNRDGRPQQAVALSELT